MIDIERWHWHHRKQQEARQVHPDAVRRPHRRDKDGVAMKQVYKITYPTGKIYIGKDSVGSARYMGSPDMNMVNADFATLPQSERKNYTLRKEILWESDTATEAELAAKEVELIRQHRSNDPAVGYNRWPKFRQ